MVYERSSLRYAHTNGHTSLIYTDTGDIITCGADGDIRKWTGIDDDDPSSSCFGEFVLCLAQKDQQLLASTDLNTVQAYTIPDFDNDGIVMRFTALANCLCVQGDYVAAGSEDTMIKVVKGTEPEAIKYPIEFTGHKGPILALDVCLGKNLLASASGDCQIKIWNLENGTEIKSIFGSIKTNTFETAKCFVTPVFEPRNGNSLAYVKEKEIIILNTNTWEVQFTLNDEKINGKYTCCKFSKDGQYLAAGTTLGEISVFDFNQRKSIKCEGPSSESKAITALAWSPKNNDELAYCDSTGQLGTLFTSEGGVNDNANNPEAGEDGFGEIEFESEAITMPDDGTDDINGDDDDPDCVSIEKLKKKVMAQATGYPNSNLPVDEETKDSMDKSICGTESESGIGLAIKMFKKQNPFQPSSTPMDLEHRYLVWNEIGIVTSHADSMDGSIDVEFHDASVHHSLHIPNYNNHNMASLSATVLAMASDNSTKMVCIALAASGNKEWSIQMPDCETVEALAATNKLVGVVTNMNFLRLFTVIGTQREVVSLPGPVIAMAGHEDSLIICYHRASPSENQQNIGAMIVRCFGLTLKVTNLPFPLPAQRTLTWLGFSDCSSPVFCDSMGLLQLYSLKSGCWYPICDTMKQSSSVSNNYFVISVSEKSQIVQAVLCRASSYPMTNPRPMLQELPMQVPLCDLDIEKSQLEDILIRTSFMNVDNSDKIIKETAIKLFALACRTEIESRAKELIETIACTDLLQLAVKYASKLGRIHLSDRLSALMPQLEEQQEEKEKQKNSQIQDLLSQSPMLLMQQLASLNNNSPNTFSKLAPKAMDLNMAKRASLKRFASSSNTTPNSTLFKKQTSLLDNTPSDMETQENILDKDSQQDSDISGLSKLSNGLDSTKDSFARSPLNPINPFAAKRKLADVDKGVIFGSEKLKIVKK